MAMWKVNAGRGSRFAGTFVERGIVAVGLHQDTDFSTCRSREEIARLIEANHPDRTERQVSVGASQLWRFLDEVVVGDAVLVYEPENRLYHVGMIGGAAEYRPGIVPDLPVVRPVAWQGTVARDCLSTSTKNSLGAILTIFRVPEEAEREVKRADNGSQPLVHAEEPEKAADPFADIGELALERVKDRINSLSWDDMQRLVAAMLRALGYRTLISPAGPDRGKDIIASRDGFGFERPRIVVEVKHRRGQMGAQEIRSFLGGRHADDRGLYVSTGGFTRDAHYEAERASTVTHLMTLDELARTLVSQYDGLDEEGRRLLPLTKIYWPA